MRGYIRSTLKLVLAFAFGSGAGVTDAALHSDRMPAQKSSDVESAPGSLVRVAQKGMVTDLDEFLNYYSGGNQQSTPPTNPNSGKPRGLPSDAGQNTRVESAAWEKARRLNSARGYREYLAAFPSGAHSARAMQCLRSPANCKAPVRTVPARQRPTRQGSGPSPY